MLTKTQKATLIKVCKVLFPKYKYVRIDPFYRFVTFTNCKFQMLSFLFPKWRVTLTELINYRIPSQLADFKYDNKTLISVIHEDLVRCELSGDDPIVYFYNEIASIKFADFYKHLQVADSRRMKLVPTSSIEEDVFQEMVEMYEKKQNSFWKLFENYQPNYEVLFYFSLAGFIIYVVLTNLKI
jgi:hypothetical protein